MTISSVGTIQDYRNDYSLSSAEKQSGDPMAMLGQMGPSDAQGLAAGALSSLPQLAQGWMGMAG